jgi:peptide/nickel transport system substrate-binding protein
MRHIKIAAVAVAVGLLVAACSSSKTASPSTSSASGSPSSTQASSDINAVHKKGGTVTIGNTMGQTWNCHFNPFNPNDYNQVVGYAYEPLVFVNALKNSAETPMLATSYTWSADKKSIVFTIRDGVKWSDGQPFSAADVVFTFNLMKKNSALDMFALWTSAGLQQVSAAGNQVTMTFKQPAQTYFFYVASQVGIVPQHIWSAGDAASAPATWANSKPVGTGPFTVGVCTTNNITYTANQNYWMPNKPSIQTVQYPAYIDNNPCNLDLANDKAQWGNQYIPNVQQFYTAKSPDHHTWNPVTNNLSLYPNLDPSHKGTSVLAVRQAIAYALDRSQIAAVGESGQLPAGNQAAIVLPTFQKYFDSAALTASGYDKPNVEKAKQLLATAGYSLSKPLALTVISITGYTDWDASLAVIKQQLKPIGINLTVVDLEQQAYNDRLFNGNFDLAYNNSSQRGPTPYYELRYSLDSANTAAIGKQANGNWERYSNPAVDKLFKEYTSADDAGQVAIIKQISSYVIKDVPIIPTVSYGSWYQYNTQDLLGWPTANDPYAQPGPYTVPDAEQVLLRLYSKSAQ